MLISLPNCHADNLGTFTAALHLFSDSVVGEKDGNSSYLTSFSTASYNSPEISGFSGGISIVDGSEVWEKNEGDSREATGTLLAQAFIQYETEEVLLRVGRQELEQEWLADFHEAVAGELRAAPGVYLRAGWSRKFAVADIDELFESFEDTGEDGVFFADVKIDMQGAFLELSPYVLHSPELFTGYGMNISYSPSSWLALGFQWGGSSVEEDGIENGSIFHVLAEFSWGNWVGRGGLIRTGDGGVGLLDSFGDSIDPFEEVSLIYEADAFTVYLAAEYQHESLALLLLVGRTELDNQYENELTALLEYDLAAFVKGFYLQGGLTYIIADDSLTDASHISVAIGWQFQTE